VLTAQKKTPNAQRSTSNIQPENIYCGFTSAWGDDGEKDHD